MAWDSTLTMVVRGLIGDLTEPYTYDDERINQIICVAGASVDQSVPLDFPYIFDLDNVTISPDPTLIPDKNAQYLFALKAVVLIAQGELRSSSDNAVSMRDGPAAIDGRGVAQSKKLIYDDALKAYEEARFSYVFGDGSVGQAIIGPYTGGGAAGGVFN